MPRRSMPGMKPAPPRERVLEAPAGSGPVDARNPWTRESFSSSVISLTRRSARSSGERDLFIQGPVMGLGRGVCWAWAATESVTRSSAMRGLGVGVWRGENWGKGMAFRWGDFL